MTAPDPDRDYVGARFAAYRAHEHAHGREPLSWAAWLRAGEPALSAPLAKAVVVYQPWATLIALEVKRVETRPLPPGGFPRPDGTRPYPGLAVEPGERIAIVAAATPWSYHDTAKTPGAPVAWEALAVAIGWTEGGRDLWSAVRGGGGQRHLTVLGNYEPGRWGWPLESTHRLPLPVPCGRAEGVRNSQGIFRLPAAVAAMIPNNKPTLEVNP